MERTLKAAGLAAGLVGLLVLVAMAARGSHPGTSGQVATRPVPNSVQDGFVTPRFRVAVRCASRNSMNRTQATRPDANPRPSNPPIGLFAQPCASNRAAADCI